MRAMAASLRRLFRRLFLGPGVAFPGQALQLFILLAEAVGDARFVLFAGGSGSLFDQLPNIVFQNPDPVVQFRLGQRTLIAHDARSGRFVGWAKRSVPTSLIWQ